MQRTVENCPYRTEVSGPADKETARCELLREISGCVNETLLTASRGACEACIRKPPPTPDHINSALASLLFGLARKVIAQGGVDGCDRYRAEKLKLLAKDHLEVITEPGNRRSRKNPSDPCLHLGETIGERQCTGCRGSVRLRVFSCLHERHVETVSTQCRTCQDYETRLGKGSIRHWSVSVTTAPRQTVTLERSLVSLAEAGWPEAQVFAEPNSFLPSWLESSRVTFRNQCLGAWPNWLLTLTEMVLRYPASDAYMLCQDDVLYSRGLRQYLEETLWPSSRTGVVSLHTASHQDEIHRTGFYPSSHGWGSWGAQAYIFPNAAARTLLRNPEVVNHRHRGPRDGLCNIDSVVGRWCLEAGLPYYLHSPSLTQHIGDTSTLWKNGSTTGRRRAATFIGEHMDIRDAMAAGRPSRFEASIPAMRRVFGENPQAKSLEDFLTVTATLGNFKSQSATHVYGKETRIVPYHDLDGKDNVRDVDANGYDRGDVFLSELYKPGDVGFLLRHQRCDSQYSGREMRFPMSMKLLKRHLKLHNIHSGFVIGADNREGAPGVVTLHSPQAYPIESCHHQQLHGDKEWRSLQAHVGRFGREPQYPMILFNLAYPKYVTKANVALFNDNIRTMAVAFNAIVDYPFETYDGNDPLAAGTVESVREHAKRMVFSIAGEGKMKSESLNWFRKEENLCYCSEFIHLATSTGLHLPLNGETFCPLVGEETWRTFTAILSDHNQGKRTPFSELNLNPNVQYISLKLAPAHLKPIWEYAPASIREDESVKLAFRPMAVDDIIRCSLADLFPEGLDGSGDAPTSLEPLGYDKNALEEMLLSPQNSPSKRGLFVPPAILHYISKGHWSGGLLGLSYVCHGLHFSLVSQTNRPAK